MSFLVPKILLIFLTFTSVASANEGGEAAKAPEQKKEVKSSEETFAVVQARVQGLEAKIRSAEGEIEKLIVEKQHTKDTQKVNEIIRQMITIHRELEHHLKEYDQQRALLKYRYPEKGQAEMREYERIELKSIEEMEGQMSLTSSVKRTLKKVRSQYETPGTEDGKAPHGDEAAAKRNKKDPSSPSSLTEPVILKK